MQRYSSPFQNRPPVSDRQLQGALAGLRPSSPYAGVYDRSHQDAVNIQGGINAEQYKDAAEKANIDYALSQRAAAQGLALAGLTQQYGARGNTRSIGDQAFANQTTAFNNLLNQLYTA